MSVMNSVDKWYNNEKSAQRDANTARADCSKVRTPPARHKHKHTDRTDYNTLRRSLARSVITSISNAPQQTS